MCYKNWETYIFELLVTIFSKPDLFKVFVSTREKACFGEVLVYSVAMEEVLIARPSDKDLFSVGWV